MNRLSKPLFAKDSMVPHQLAGGRVLQSLRQVYAVFELVAVKTGEEGKTLSLKNDGIFTVAKLDQAGVDAMKQAVLQAMTPHLPAGHEVGGLYFLHLQPLEN